MRVSPASNINAHGIAREVVERLRGAPSAAAEPPQCIRIPPLRVHGRRSTEIVAAEDAVVAKALELIRGGFREMHSVDELAALTGVSRRQLELRFQESLQSTPYRELLRVKVAAAREMLATTDYAVRPQFWGLFPHGESQV